MHYLSDWRLLLAARRLEERRTSIEAVAAEVGYRSPAAFQRTFKRRHGETPAAYRKRRAAAASS